MYIVYIKKVKNTFTFAQFVPLIRTAFSENPIEIRLQFEAIF